MSDDFIFSFILVFLISLGLDIFLFNLAKKYNFEEAGKEKFRSFIEAINRTENNLLRVIKANFGRLRKRSYIPIADHSETDPIIVENGRPEVNFEKKAVSYTSESIPGVSGERISRVVITADIPAGTTLQINITANSNGENGNSASIQFVENGIESRPLNRQKQIKNSRSSLIDLSFFGNTYLLIKDKLRSFTEAQFHLFIFLLSLIVYLFTRFSGLVNFPIYFLGDEAVQSVSAMSLIKENWLGAGGQFLPTYFPNGAYFNLGTSVYLQLIPTLVLGNSILVTRGTFALLSLLAAFSTGLILKDFFEVKRWWIATLTLSIIPAWFLHSRTGFETSVFVSFYSAFIYFYFSYRQKNPNYIYPAILSAALSFYSYSPGQMIIAVSVFLLLIADMKYHLQQKGKFIPIIFLTIFAFLPYLRFRLTNEYSPLDHLRQLGSYWIEPISFAEKISRFLQEYLYGLSPQYWFFSGHEPVLTFLFPANQIDVIFSNSVDLTRHMMKGYGNISIWAFPFFILGSLICLRNFKIPSSRNLLLITLSIPSGAALANIGITRVLVFVIPASIFIALGLDLFVSVLEKQIQKRFFINHQTILSYVISIMIFIILASINFSMLKDSLTNGPTWFPNYSLYGMQYGAKQIFEDSILPGLKADPNRKYVVSPSWANGTEQFTSFFLSSDVSSRVDLAQPINYTEQLKKGLPDTIFVTTAEEYNNLLSSPEFTDIHIEKIIPYPDGQPGYYFITLHAASNIDAIIAAEHEKNRKPIEENAVYHGIKLKVMHSPFGIGLLNNVFDDDPFSLVRSLEANPFLFDIFPEKPIDTRSIKIQTGSQQKFTVTINLYPVDSTIPVTYSNTYSGLPTDPVISINFDKGPAVSSRIKIELKDEVSGETSEIHVRTLEIK